MPDEEKKVPVETPETEPEQGAQVGADGQKFDPERAMNTIKTLREEVKTLKASARGAQTKAEREKMSEIDRLKAELAEANAAATAAQTAATERELRLKVTRAASKAGFNDPDDAWGLLDLAEVGTDIDGGLADLLKRKPYLGRSTSTSGATNGGGNGASGSASKTSAGNPAGGGGLTIDQIKAMTPAQIQARRKEVQEVLHNQG